MNVLLTVIVRSVVNLKKIPSMTVIIYWSLPLSHQYLLFPLQNEKPDIFSDTIAKHGHRFRLKTKQTKPPLRAVSMK